MSELMLMFKVVWVFIVIVLGLGLLFVSSMFIAFISGMIGAGIAYLIEKLVFPVYKRWVK